MNLDFCCDMQMVGSGHGCLVSTVGGGGVWNVCLAHIRPLIHTKPASFECHGLSEFWSWPRAYIYNHIYNSRIMLHKSSQTGSMNIAMSSVYCTGLRRSESNFGMWQNRRFPGFMDVKLTNLQQLCDAFMNLKKIFFKPLWEYFISQI